MFNSLVLVEFFLSLFLLLLPGCALIFFADYLAKRRNEYFLGALDHIINKKDYEKKTDKNADE